MEAQDRIIHAGRGWSNRGGVGRNPSLLPAAIGMAFLLALPLLKGCDNGPSAAAAGGVATVVAVARGARPALDLAAPAKIETATFSLG
jgi:hypothetical protein